MMNVSHEVNLLSLNTHPNTNKLYKLYLTVCVILSVMCAYQAFHKGLSWIDQPIHWRTCAYTIKGMDIYTLRGSSNFLPEIGPIVAGFHSSPWGCLLQTIFYGGFLSYEASRVYFIVANIVVIAAASWTLYRKINMLSPELGKCALLLSLLSPDVMSALYFCNAGAMIAAFILMAWLIKDEHEYLSGVLLGFAMVKPQCAVIVCLAFLLMKKFKPVIVAAVIVLSAWLAVSVLTHKGMLELLRLFLLSPNRNEVHITAGIFTLLLDPMKSLIASMIFGIVFMWVLQYLLPQEIPEHFKIYPAFISLTFWCYSNFSDYYVLVILALLCLYLMFLTGKIFWFLSSIYCAYGVVIRGVIRRALSIPNGVFKVQITIHNTGLIILGIIICIELRRIYMEAKS